MMGLCYDSSNRCYSCWRDRTFDLGLDDTCHWIRTAYPKKKAWNQGSCYPVPLDQCKPDAREELELDD